MINLSIGRKLKKLRKEHHLTQKEVANELGISQQLLGMYENDKRIPKINRIKKLTKFYGITYEELMDSECSSSKSVIQLSSWIKVPVLGEIACGQPLLAEENIEAYQSIPANMLPRNARDVFGLYAHGDSMYPHIEDGDLLIIHKQSYVEDGEVAAVLINEDATLKRIKHLGDQILLMPDNHDYDPIILNPNDDNRILGKVILKISKSI